MLAVLVGVSVAMRTCLSCTGYYLIADKYKTISEEVPKKFDKRPTDQPPPPSRTIHKVLLACNIFFPFANGVAVFLYEYKKATHPD
jgi:hypothetical protein